MRFLDNAGIGGVIGSRNLTGGDWYPEDNMTIHVQDHENDAGAEIVIQTFDSPGGKRTGGIIVDLTAEQIGYLVTDLLAMNKRVPA